MRGILAASIAMLAVVVIPGAWAEATTATSTTTVPFDQSYSGCGGQYVEAEGETTITFHTTVDATENVHVSTHARTHGTGVGTPDGAIYQINGIDNAETNGTKTADGAIEFTTLASAVVVGQGPANNSHFFVLVHTTISEGAGITSQVVESYFMCPDAYPAK